MNNKLKKNILENIPLVLVAISMIAAITVVNIFELQNKDVAVNENTEVVEEVDEASTDEASIDTSAEMVTGSVFVDKETGEVLTDKEFNEDTLYFPTKEPVCKVSYNGEYESYKNNVDNIEITLNDSESVYVYTNTFDDTTEFDLDPVDLFNYTFVTNYGYDKPLKEIIDNGYDNDVYYALYYAHEKETEDDEETVSDIIVYQRIDDEVKDGKNYNHFLMMHYVSSGSIKSYEDSLAIIKNIVLEKVE